MSEEALEIEYRLACETRLRPQAPMRAKDGTARLRRKLSHSLGGGVPVCTNVFLKFQINNTDGTRRTPCKILATSIGSRSTGR